jgi:hypothetical protein
MKLTKRAKIKAAPVKTAAKPTPKPARKPRKPATAAKAAVSAPPQNGATDATAKLPRGFRLMTIKQRSAIAALGGSAVAAKYGSKHMAKIGAIGGRNGSRTP